MVVVSLHARTCRSPPPLVTLLTCTPFTIEASAEHYLINCDSMSPAIEHFCPESAIAYRNFHVQSSERWLICRSFICGVLYLQLYIHIYVNHHYYIYLFQSIHPSKMKLMLYINCETMATCLV